MSDGRGCCAYVELDIEVQLKAREIRSELFAKREGGRKAKGREGRGKRAHQFGLQHLFNLSRRRELVGVSAAGPWTDSNDLGQV